MRDFKRSVLVLIFVLFPALFAAGADNLAPDYQTAITMCADTIGNDPGPWLAPAGSIVYIPGDGSTDNDFGLKYDASHPTCLITRTATKASYYTGSILSYVHDSYKILDFRSSPADDAAWVTTGNQVTQFVLNSGNWASGDNVTTLLERGLGMQNNDSHDMILEIAIIPDADGFDNVMMRPVKNPDVETYSTTASDYGNAATFQQPAGMTSGTVYEYFQTYYNNWKVSALDNRTFPWTQMGYTFFWGNGSTQSDIQGMTEFIVLAKTTVNLYAMYATSSYAYTLNNAGTFSSVAAAQFGNGFASFNIDGSYGECKTVWAGHRFQKLTLDEADGTNEIIVTNSGTVTGSAGSGILVWSLNYKVTNNGYIYGANTIKFGLANTDNISILFRGDTSTDYGTPVNGINELVNTGTISSPGTAIRVDNGDTKITNSGTISGDTYGLDITAGGACATTINNTGYITGNTAIEIDSGALTLTGTGTINGTSYAIRTAGGDDDTITVTGGYINGIIDLYNGDDVLSINNAKMGFTLDRATATSAQYVSSETVSIADVAPCTFAVNVAPGTKNVQNNENFLIVDAQDLTVDQSNFVIQNDNSLPMVTFSAVVSGAQIYLVANRDNAYYGANAGNRSLGTVLDDLANTSDGDMATIIGALDDSGSPSNADKLEPLADSGALNGSIESMTQYVNTVVDHVNGASGGSGISTGDDGLKNVGVWARGFGNYSHQDPRGSSNGYNSTLWGTAFGFDLEGLESFRYGLSGGFAQDFLRSKDNSGRTDIDSYQASAYAMLDKGNYYLDGVLTFAYNQYDASRHIAIGVIDRTANSSYNGQQYSVYTETGYDLDMGKLTLTPLISFQYMHLRINPYTEKDAGAADLEMKGQDYDMAQLGAGLKLAHSFNYRSVTFIPEVHGKWLYDFVGDRQAMSSTFTGGGTAFSTDGFEPAQSTYNVGAKLTFITKNDVTLSLNYDLELKEDYYGHSGYVNVRYDF